MSSDQDHTLRLRSIRSFHVGGSVCNLRGLPVEMRRFAQNGAARAVDPNGDHVTGQMYVQAYLQAEPRHRWPVLLWHGGGMTGANWESTPDGRHGWLTEFLRAGFDVYVCDAVERGRSSWSRWPEIYAEAPLFRTLNEGWDMFRMGPPGSYGSYDSDVKRRTSYAHQQFPVEAFDAFASQWVPRWAGHEDITLRAYDALLAQVGTCVVVGHSQGGGFALEAARRHPESVAAVVALEPSGAPRVTLSQAVQSAQVGPTPHLILWGDHITDHPVWTRYRETVDDYVATLAWAGVPVCIDDLPRAGILGNSHFPMMDRNSELIAERVIDWLSNNTRDMDRS
jgi:pimeloyl-ACP methyl ester carboxylesterase